MDPAPPSIIWSLATAHPDAAHRPGLLTAALDSGDPDAAIGVLRHPGIDEATALRAVQVLIPRRGELRWQYARDLADLDLPPTAQQHLARTVVGGLEKLAPAFVDPTAVAVLVGRALPATPPQRVDRDGNRPAPGAALPLLALLEMTSGTTAHDDALLAADLFAKAFAKLATGAYAGATAYADKLTDVLIAIGARHPAEFCAAAAGKNLPWGPLRSIAAQTWIDAGLVATLYQAATARLDEQGIWATDFNSWVTLRYLLPHLDDTLRGEVRDRLKQIDPDLLLRAPFGPWAGALLTHGATAEAWTHPDIAVLRAELVATEHKVPDDVLLDVVARADLTTEEALRVAAGHRVSPQLLAARRDPEWPLGLLARCPSQLGMWTRDDETLAGTWDRGDRLDLAVEVLARRCRAAVDRDALVPNSGDRFPFFLDVRAADTATHLGADRVLRLPWWMLAEWAQRDEVTAEIVGATLLDALEDPATRPALVRLSDDALAGRTDATLPDLVGAAQASAVA